MCMYIYSTDINTAPTAAAIAATVATKRTPKRLNSFENN